MIRSLTPYRIIHGCCLHTLSCGLESVNFDFFVEIIILWVRRGCVVMQKCTLCCIAPCILERGPFGWGTWESWATLDTVDRLFFEFYWYLTIKCLFFKIAYRQTTHCLSKFATVTAFQAAREPLLFLSSTAKTSDQNIFTRCEELYANALLLGGRYQKSQWNRVMHVGIIRVQKWSTYNFCQVYVYGFD